MLLKTSDLELIGFSPHWIELAPATGSGFVLQQNVSIPSVFGNRCFAIKLCKMQNKAVFKRYFGIAAQVGFSLRERLNVKDLIRTDLESSGLTPSTRDKIIKFSHLMSWIPSESNGRAVKIGNSTFSPAFPRLLLARNANAHSEMGAQGLRRSRNSKSGPLS
jgi:hypothetical protein